ncbi:MAG: Gfo/Idh/MocA family oxidoreductase [Solirubrobacteraceae bacterium]|nr:Gfo/Idh/MocA family oxidoreductase [Solirubrobacteraceae bacterium]
MIRVGIIGLGEIGQYHLPALRVARGAELVAVCDLDRALAERSAAGACAAYDDLEAMLSSAALDLLDVCLPHHLHRPVALRAIDAGCHVLLEKPMAISVAECDEIAAAAERAGRLVAISHNQLHYEPHRRLSALIEAGALGELRMLRARLAIGGRYGAWRSDPAKAGGGLLIDAGAHRLYLLRALGGPVHAVSAMMDDPGSEERLVVTLEFASGALGVIDAAYGAPDGVVDDRVEAMGSRALAEVRGCEALFEGFAANDAPLLRLWSGGAWVDDPARGSWDDSVRASVRAAVEAIAHGERPPQGPAEGREVLALVEAAYGSARAGERVVLGG